MMKFKSSMNDGGSFSPMYACVMMKGLYSHHITLHKFKELSYDYALWVVDG